MPPKKLFAFSALIFFVSLFLFAEVRRYAAGKRRFIIPGFQSMIWLAVVIIFFGRAKSAAAMNVRIPPPVETAITPAARDQEVMTQSQKFIQSRKLSIESNELRLVVGRNSLIRSQNEGRIPPSLQGEFLNLEQRLTSFYFNRPCTAALSKESTRAVEYDNLLRFEQTKPINQRNERKLSIKHRECSEAEKHTNREFQKMGQLESDVTRFVEKIDSTLTNPKSPRVIDKIRRGERPLP